MVNASHLEYGNLVVNGDVGAESAEVGRVNIQEVELGLHRPRHNGGGQRRRSLHLERVGNDHAVEVNTSDHMALISNADPDPNSFCLPNADPDPGA